MIVNKRMKKVLIILILIGILLPLCSSSPIRKNSRFDVNSAFLKLSMKGNETILKNLKITSHGDYDFHIKVGEVNFISTNEKEFKMKTGEEKTINISFNDDGKKPGVYFGNIIITAGDTTLKIPTIMDVESSDVLFDGTLSVPVNDINVFPGGNIIVDNKIFNLDNIGAKNVHISYLLKSFDGETIFSDEQNIVVRDHISNTEVVAIPHTAIAGSYLFVAIMKYKNSVGVTSYFFQIKNKRSSTIQINSLWLLVVLTLFLLIGFLVFYTLRRDNILLELENQYQREISNRVLELEKEKKIAENLDSKKRKAELKQIKKKYLKNIKSVKGVYRHRVKVIKKLRRTKKISEMDRKLKEWRKAGYDIGNLNSIEKTNKDIVKEYAKEGYNL